MMRRFLLIAVLAVALSFAGCDFGSTEQETQRDPAGSQEDTQSHGQTTVPETTELNFDGEVEVDFSDFEDMQPDTTVAGSDSNTETFVPVQPETTVSVLPQTTVPIPPETTTPEKPVVYPTEVDEEPITEETTVATTEQPPAPTETVPPTTAEPGHDSENFDNRVVRP